MKRLTAYTLLLFLSLGFGACTDNFEEINEPPIGLSGDRFDVNPLFTRATVYGALRYTEFQRAQHLYAHHYVQYYSVARGDFQTGRYITRDDWLTDYWNEAYSDYLMNIQQVIDLTDPADDPLNNNKHQIARIWKVYLMHRVTDFWGDVPYSEAFSGDEGILSPAYDPQEVIYTDMLTELEEAVAAIDPEIDRGYGAADHIYGSSIDYWSRFGNSLRLRLAMRISGVSPALAEQHVRTVLAEGNIISSNAQGATMPYGRDFGGFDESVQPMSILRGFESPPEFRVSNTLLDFLEDFNDPRLPVYVAPAKSDATFRGLQNGLGPNELSVLDMDDYSKSGTIPSNPNASSGLLIYPEVKFLEAEAALLGWHDGNTQAHYEEGIRASMEYWQAAHDDLRATLDAGDADLVANVAVDYPNDPDEVPVIDITPEAVDDYLLEAGVAFDAGNALELIHTQKYLALLDQGFETYAEYRRSGFPVLNEIPNTNGESETGGTDVPTRVRYPVAEQNLNTGNYNEAVQRIGGDFPTTRVWWDVD